MSETVNQEEPSLYPPLSEATENDVREAAPEPVDGAPADAAPEGPAAETAAETTEAPQEETEEDLAARNARLARMVREEKRRARQLELEAQALRGQRQEQPNEQMMREIEQRAALLAQQQAINQKANDVYSAGVKEFGRVEFDESVKAVNETFGANMMPVVIDTLVDLDAPQRLISHLADNPDIADQLATLPPHKLGAALAREAAKLSAPKVKPVSRAPAPIRPIAQTSTAEPETDVEKMSMDELAKLWDARDFRKRMGF